MKTVQVLLSTLDFFLSRGGQRSNQKGHSTWNPLSGIHQRGQAEAGPYLKWGCVEYRPAIKRGIHLGTPSQGLIKEDMQEPPPGNLADPSRRTFRNPLQGTYLGTTSRDTSRRTCTSAPQPQPVQVWVRPVLTSIRKGHSPWNVLLLCYCARA